jgi:hypothetical protein
VRQLVIDAPVTSLAFLEPAKHHRFTDDAISNEIVESRRPSAHSADLVERRSGLTIIADGLACWMARASTSGMGQG